MVVEAECQRDVIDKSMGVLRLTNKIRMIRAELAVEFICMLFINRVPEFPASIKYLCNVVCIGFPVKES